MMHGDAHENGDVLECTRNTAFMELGQASRAIWILGAWAERVA